MKNASNLHSPETNYFQSRFRNMFSLKFLVSSYEKLPGKKVLHNFKAISNQEPETINFIATTL